MQSKVWNDCLSILKSDLTDSQFNTWIKPLSVIEDEESQTITLLAPNKFVVNWVQKNYLEKIKNVASKKLAGNATVAISVGEEPYSDQTSPSSTKRAGTPVGSPLNSRYVLRYRLLKTQERLTIPFLFMGGWVLEKHTLCKALVTRSKKTNPT